MERTAKIFLNFILRFAFFMAKEAVNTTCCGRYFQEALDEQLSQLRKYE